MLYEDYEKMLKSDEGNKRFNEILNSALEKVEGVSPKLLTDEEAYALVDALDGFEYWPVCIDYWEEEIDDAERMDVSIEYAGRKLCELIDTSAQKEELDRWLEVYFGYERYRFCIPSEKEPNAVEQKLLDWGERHTELPEDFANSLSSAEVQTLLRSAYGFDNCDLPTTEDGSGLSRYEIVGQYIKSLLCCLIDQRENSADIMRWYNLNLAFNYA